MYGSLIKHGLYIILCCLKTCGPGSSVGIETGYGLEGLGIESRWGWNFPHLSRTALGPTQSPVQSVPSFPQGKERPGREANPSPPSSSVVKKEQSYSSTPAMGRTACTEPQCLYSRAIPLLPLWTVRTVQSLSACTVQLYLHSHYGPYGLYTASVPVQYSYSYTCTPPMGRTACTAPQCLYSTAIPLLPL